MALPGSVGSTRFEMPSDLEIVAIHVVDAPRTLVWDAFTRPEHVSKWLLGPVEGTTMPVCEIDLRPGGAWRYVWRDPSGGEMAMTGTYLEVTPPERLVNTESWGEGFPGTTNTLALTEEAGRTTITQTIRYASIEARDQATATGMAEGWAASNEQLVRYLATLR